MISEAAVREDLKLLIIESLNLEGLNPNGIGDETPLFGEGLGLDSVDALELVLAIEKKYGLEIQPHEVDRQVFACVKSLSGFVAQLLAGSNGNSAADGR
jgi:acyl carrier protein